MPLTRVTRWIAFASALILFLLLGRSDVRIEAQSACGTTINPIVCENQNAGSPASEWDVAGAGDSSIQGFATDISAAPGQVQQFKINTPSSSYGIDIYRMGYYGGGRARERAASLAPPRPAPAPPARPPHTAAGGVHTRHRP